MIHRIALCLALLSGAASLALLGTSQPSLAADCGDQQGGCDFGNSNGGSGGIKGAVKGIQQQNVRQPKIKE